MRPHHHVRVTSEMKLDLQMWKAFLVQNNAVLRPFVDFDDEINFSYYPIFSDAAKARTLGYSACFLKYDTFEALYCFGQWEQQFLVNCDPSVQFLELLALSVGVILFAPYLRNKRATIFCDNQPVIQMVNNGSSSCKHCMLLIRTLTLCCLEYNIVLQVEYIPTESNVLADLLSRNRRDKFLNLLPKELTPIRLVIPSEFLPFEKFFTIY